MSRRRLPPAPGPSRETQGTRVASEEPLRDGVLWEQLLLHSAHEIRSPLGALLLWIEIHAAEHQEPSSSFARIGASARDLSRLVEEMVDAVQVLSGRAELRRAPVSLADLVQRCLSDILGEVDHDGLLKAGATPELPAIWADGERLLRALRCVVRAAMKVDGPRVEVSVAGDAGWAQFRVARSGPAGPGSASSDVSIALARRIAELHGGGLESSSADGGTVWVLRLPFLPPPTPAGP